MWNINLLTTSTLKFRKLFYLILKKKMYFNFFFLIGKKAKNWFNIYTKEKRQCVINQIKTKCFNLEYNLYVLEYFMEYKNIKNILLSITYLKNNFLVEYDAFNFLFKNYFKNKNELLFDIIIILYQNNLLTNYFDITEFYNYNYLKLI